MNLNKPKNRIIYNSYEFPLKLNNKTVNLSNMYKKKLIIDKFKSNLQKLPFFYCYILLQLFVDFLCLNELCDKRRVDITDYL